jgi:hypothetical protein
VALEFRTRDEHYKGPCVLPRGAQIAQASIFVDHLPPEVSTARYDPHLVKDRYSHRPRYVIDANIFVYDDCLKLVGFPTNGLASINSEQVELIDNMSIGRGGLDVLLIHDGHEYQSVLYPIPVLPVPYQRQHNAR